MILYNYRRITRRTEQLLDVMQMGEERNIRTELWNIVLDCTEDSKTDVTTKAMLQMIGVFSEIERTMICERVKSGMGKMLLNLNFYLMLLYEISYNPHF